MTEVTVYTDGSCWPNPGGPGGFAAVLISSEGRREISGGYRASTNNRMELMACIAGLSAFPEPVKAKVITDSQYLANGSKWAPKWRAKGWRTAEKKPVKNKDLWEMILFLITHHTVEFEWVRGHDGNEENEVCDILAGQAAKRPNLKEDKGFCL